MIRQDVIQSDRDKRARMILVKRQAPPKGFPADLVNAARRKLVQLDAAARLDDLAVPPGNHLEALKRELAGRHAIRINDQWRIVFRWTEGGPAEVEIDDYH